MKLLNVTPKPVPGGVRLHVNDEFGGDYATVLVMSDGSLGHWDGNPSTAGYVTDAWPRYHAEKAKRAVVLSAETMRPADEHPAGNPVVLAVATNGLPVLVSNLGGAWCQAARGISHVHLKGWWPVPDLSPMPEEFAGWSV